MQPIFLVLSPTWAPVVWTLLGFFAALGLLALISPQVFQRLATSTNRWVDTDKIAKALDKPIDVDRFLLPYSRLLGVAVLVSVGVIGFLVLRI